MSAAAEPGRESRRARALDGGRLLAGVGALMLLVSLFLDWWGASDTGLGDPDRGITAWNVFELVDILLAALALATLAFAVESLARPGRQRLPVLIADAAGPIALVLIVVSLINKPPVLGFDPGIDPELGAWLGLAGAVVMTVGALLRHARISITVTPRERSSSETETRPRAEEPRRPLR